MCEQPDSLVRLREARKVYRTTIETRVVVLSQVHYFCTLKLVFEYILWSYYLTLVVCFAVFIGFPYLFLIMTISSFPHAAGTPYFREAGLKFLRSLKRNNRREWFEAHKQEFERELK